MNRRFSLGMVLTILLATPVQSSRAEENTPIKKNLPKSPQAWTLDEARQQIHLNPDDAYLQYVALQLARQEGKAPEVASEIESLHGRSKWQPDERRVDLFDLFTGSLAVQESLQLEALRPQVAGVHAAADAARGPVKTADLQGPSTKSHPWGKMLAAQMLVLGGKTPDVSPLSLCVPEDQYYVEFHSLGKLLEASEAGDLWGDHLFTQAAKTAQSQGASQRLKSQLAIQTDLLVRPFYDLVVDEVVLTGNDLYFREGTDVTMLFALKQPEVFRLRMDGFLDAAAKSRPDAVRSTGKILGIDYVQVVTPDRAISALSAYPRPNLHVRSNSLAALRRVLAAIDGKPAVARLGDSAEFKYIRTLMPRGDRREDGFVYLSDPFIRRLVGPEMKLAEARRMVCYNHLRMIGHAAMLYRTQFGKQAKSLDELVESGCAPAFLADPRAAGGNDLLACPDGGTYTLSEDGTTGVCSHHGHSRQLAPCLEALPRRVSAREAEEYRQFVEQYNRYWRIYFDPTAVRIQMTPKQYRAETIILPLIDNSIYSGLAQSLGGTPEPLDGLPLPKRTIFSVVVRLNKEQLLKQFSGLLHRQNAEGFPTPETVYEFLTEGIGNQIGLHVYDATPTFDFNLSGFLGEMLERFRGASGEFSNETGAITFLVASLNAPVYAAVPVKDGKVVDKFLGELDEALARLARRPDREGWLPVEHDFYKVPLAGADQRIRCYGIALGPVKWRLFYARIGDVLYVASKQCILEDLATTAKRPSAGGAVVHAMVRVRPEHWKDVLPEYRLGWEENSRQACLGNLGPLSCVARALSAGSTGAATSAAVQREAEKLYGVHFYCPDGGKYEVSADGKQVTCRTHGSAEFPQQLGALTAGSPAARLLDQFGGATAELTFLEDGLHAVVTIQRK